MFGAGSGNFLTKATKYAAIFFFSAAVLLSLMENSRARQPGSAFRRSLEEQQKQAAQPPAPAPGTPGGPITTLVPSRPVRELPERVAVVHGNSPCVLENLVVDAAGDLDLQVLANGEEIARANPMRVVTAAPLRRYWGDLHGQSGETIGMGTAESYFRYARDWGL